MTHLARSNLQDQVMTINHRNSDSSIQHEKPMVSNISDNGGSIETTRISNASDYKNQPINHLQVSLVIQRICSSCR